jgi:hypothetical protein
MPFALVGALVGGLSRHTIFMRHLRHFGKLLIYIYEK